MICLSIQAISIAPWSRLVTTRVGWAGDLIKGVCDSPLMAGRRCRLSLSSEGRDIIDHVLFQTAGTNYKCRLFATTSTVDHQHGRPTTCLPTSTLHLRWERGPVSPFRDRGSALCVLFVQLFGRRRVLCLPPFEAERIIHILRPWTVLPLR